jgi:hypothetical protein
MSDFISPEAATGPDSSAPSGRTPELTVEQDTPCVGCGYNLRTLRIDAICPECATPISFSLPGLPRFVRKPKVDTPLDRETPCVCCGTILRTQTTHDSCPGCRAPVWFSLYGLWLRASDPSWLRRVRSGVILWIWLIVISFVLGCLGGIVGGVLGFMGYIGTDDIEEATTVGMYFGVILGVVVTVLYLVVAGRITTPNPAIGRRQAPDRMARAIKAGFVIGLCGSCAVLAVRVLELPSWLGPVCSSVTLASLLATVGLIHYLRGIAARIPDRSLERSAAILVWGYGLSTGALQLCSMASLGQPDAASSLTPGTPATPGFALGCTMLVFSLTALGFTIWLVVLLSKILSALTNAIGQVTADRVAGVQGMANVE